jgi:hypothetical protein
MREADATFPTSTPVRVYCTYCLDDTELTLRLCFEVERQLRSNLYVRPARNNDTVYHRSMTTGRMLDWVQIDLNGQ